MTPYVTDSDFTLYVGDALDVLRSMTTNSVDCCVTSPPYLDARPEYPSPSPAEWSAIFTELRRVVRGPALINTGRIFRGGERRWWNELLEIAESSGWTHLDTVVWVKPNGNPIHGAVFSDRHEYVFALGDPCCEFSIDAVRVAYAEGSIARLRRGWTNHTGVKNEAPGRRRNGQRSSEPHPLGGRPPSYLIVDVGAEKGNPHPAPMPLSLALELVALGSWPGGVVLDPFCGSGTTCLAARQLGRRSIGIELLEGYGVIAARRLQQLSLLAQEATA